MGVIEVLGLCPDRFPSAIVSAIILPMISLIKIITGKER